MVISFVGMVISSETFVVEMVISFVDMVRRWSLGPNFSGDEANDNVVHMVISSQWRWSLASEIL